jgi:CubicO group peptidase (beta-lactamase class C family)
MRVAALWLVFAASLQAATKPAVDSKITAYLAPVVASGDFNGVVVVAKGDVIVVSRSFGKADWDLNVPLSVGSRFRIASITKTFTAAAIAILAERGKLSLSDSLSKYIPDFPNGDKITLRLLLLHRSGVPNPDSTTCSAASLDDLVAELAKKPLWFEPGKASGYSNGGYALLARVIERASGQSWSDFLTTNIFRPLSLAHTSIDNPFDVVPMRARGYVPGPGSAGVQHALCEGAWAAVGSGAVVSTAEDLVRWARAIQKETLFKRTALEYPYGWGVRDYFHKHFIEQSGIVNGFSSYLSIDLDDDVIVVVLSNVQTGELTDMGKGLAALAIGDEPPKLTASPAIVPMTNEQRTAWVGQFKNEHIATVTITDNGGVLYMRWADSPDRVFLAPAGAMNAYDRQDGVALELMPDHDAIRMRWGSGEPQDFKRLP